LKRYFIFICFIVLSLVAVSQTYTGSVIRVIDGDTFVFQTQDGSFIVRMYGTDAPERDQPYTRESADFLKRYLNKNAVLKANGTDRYGRRTGVLFVKRKDINLLSIRGGYSWHFRRYSKDQEYAEAEKYARKNKSGLWSLPNPISPWEWRK